MDDRLRRRLDELIRWVPGPALQAMTLTGRGGFASAFDVDGLVFAAAAAANLSFGVAELDRARVVALCAGQAWVDGRPVPSWAGLSGYYRTRGGGYIQLHANFPHHAQGILDRLGCAPTREAVQEAVLGWDADALESVLIADGMIAARLRTLAEWESHPHAVATCNLPVVSVEQIGEARPRDAGRRRRVLDCSRVLAGPVAGLQLAAYGADVLRVGSAHLPAVEIGVLTTGSGKRNAFVELGAECGRQRFGALLGSADIWIDAYRPGSFEDRGFSPSAIGPGGVVVQISAFDYVGPWSGRRGFDSIVQSTTGLVLAGAAAAGTSQPTPLPVQALDYATGLVAAFAAERLVRHQAEVGGTWVARLSLLRTRNWLLAASGPTAFTPRTLVVDASAMHTVDTPFGAVTTARPIGGSWPRGPQPLGASEPKWLV